MGTLVKKIVSVPIVTMVTLITDITARSKAWVCGRLLAGIGGSDPTGGIWFVCMLCVGGETGGKETTGEI